MYIIYIYIIIYIYSYMLSVLAPIFIYPDNI